MNSRRGRGIAPSSDYHRTTSNFGEFPDAHSTKGEFHRTSLGAPVAIVAAFILFILNVRWWGGVSFGDSAESINSTWAFAHHQFTCAYAPNNEWRLPYIAPLYPLLSGVIVHLLSIGSGSTFPAGSVLGAHCGNAISLYTQWSLHALSLQPTLHVGYVGGLILLAGVGMFLQTHRHVTTRRWAVVGLWTVAVSPPVTMCLSSYFHPQDLVAMGLIFVALSLVSRDEWWGAGFVLGLAVCTQQFAVLAVLAVWAISTRYRYRLIAGVALGFLVVALPLELLSHGAATSALLLGSGDGLPVPGSLMDVFHIGSPIGVVLARYGSTLATLVGAWLLQREIGSRVREPAVLLSLVGTALAMRLVFEFNFYGYYFMATSVVLIVLTVVFERRISLALIVWLVIIHVCGITRGPLDPIGDGVPIWLLQLVLVPWTVWMCSRPLRRAVGARRSSVVLPLESSVRSI